MISGIILDGADIKFYSRNKFDSFQADIKFNGAEFAKTEMSLRFSWSVIYSPNIGYITLEGRLQYSDTQARIAKLQAGWADGKSVPAEFVQEIINGINHYCTVNSAVVLKAFDIAPPIKVQPISVSQAKA